MYVYTELGEQTERERGGEKAQNERECDDLTVIEAGTRCLAEHA